MKSLAVSIVASVMLLSPLAQARSFSKVVCATGPNLVLAATNLNRTAEAEMKKQIPENAPVSCWLNSKSMSGLNSHTVKATSASGEAVEACTALNFDITCG